ncbi:MAG: ribonucleotide-diphosphate reductase subunit beta [Thermoleophilaceae bacterium]
MATAAPPIEAVSYTDLYERWEKSNWSAREIDFSTDREDWHERFSEFERKAALWNYALFFWGEDAVTDGLSPYIDAAPLEEQKYFLTTQQVDEARHAIFFARWMDEVAGLGSTPGEALAAIEPQLTWGFKKVFGRLVTMADELRRDRSKPKLAAAVTLYHMVIEAGLAQPGQHLIQSYLEERDLMPGFRGGMENVSRDEQRHIGFGVKLLHDLNKEDPDCRYAVADLLREVTPYTIGVLVPPNWDRRYVECFGYTLEEIYVTGVESLYSKLRAAGLDIETLPGPPPLPADLSPEEQASRAIRLQEAGILGEKIGPPSRDPDDVATLFDVVRRSLDTEQVPHDGFTIEWDFTDAEPWHLVVANGDTRAVQGASEKPELVMRARFEDFVDIAAGRRDPVRAMATGRLRPRGNPVWLWRARKLFG